MKIILYVLIGVGSAIVANYFGFELNQAEYWAISLGIIIPANLIVSAF